MLSEEPLAQLLEGDRLAVAVAEGDPVELAVQRLPRLALPRVGGGRAAFAVLAPMAAPAAAVPGDRTGLHQPTGTFHTSPHLRQNITSMLPLPDMPPTCWKSCPDMHGWLGPAPWPCAITLDWALTASLLRSGGQLRGYAPRRSSRRTSRDGSAAGRQAGGELVGGPARSIAGSSSPTPAPPRRPRRPSTTRSWLCLDP